MSALYGLSSVNLKHIDLFKWAEKNKVFIPLNFRSNDEIKECFLKILSSRDHFIKLPPLMENDRYHKAIKQAYKYLPSEGGLSERTILIIRVAGVVFLAIVHLTANAMTSKL